MDPHQGSGPPTPRTPPHTPHTPLETVHSPTAGDVPLQPPPPWASHSGRRAACRAAQAGDALNALMLTAQNGGADGAAADDLMWSMASCGGGMAGEGTQGELSSVGSMSLVALLRGATGGSEGGGMGNMTPSDAHMSFMPDNTADDAAWQLPAGSSMRPSQLAVDAMSALLATVDVGGVEAMGEGLAGLLSLEDMDDDDPTSMFIM